MFDLALKNYLSGDDFYYIHRERFLKKELIEMHRHSFCEIFWIEQGTGTHIINNNSFNLDTGHLSIIQPDDCHSIIAKPDMQLINIAFPAESLFFLLNRYKELFSDKRNSMDWSLNKEDMIQLMNNTDTLLNRDNSQLNLEVFLMNLFAILTENINSTASTESHLSKKAPLWIEQFFKLLENEENLSLPLDNLAENVGRTREHLSRQLKEYYTRTPSQFITIARVKYARKQLALTKRPILEIALSCGFSSLSQFYKIFKEETGLTPSAFRKNKP